MAPSDKPSLVEPGLGLVLEPGLALELAPGLVLHKQPREVKPPVSRHPQH